MDQIFKCSSTMGDSKKVKLQDIWRTFDKIRSAIFRVKLNLWEYFLPFDKTRKNVMTESTFIQILSGKLKGWIGLTDQEITDLADYFRCQDGRVLYAQFCGIIHDVEPNFEDNDLTINSLEWEDPLHKNRLNQREMRRFNLLLTQIALIINRKKLILRPYFQEHELVHKYGGTITFAHFARILNYLHITIAAEEFNLLLKRYSKDSYTIAYESFVQDLEKMQNYMRDNGMHDFNGDMIQEFPGRILSVDLPKLPRPEFDGCCTSHALGNTFIDLPYQSNADRQRRRPLDKLIERIQRHIFERRIPITYFFKQLDIRHRGRMSPAAFRRSLDALQVASFGRIYLSELEIDDIVKYYSDPNEPELVCWRTFEDDVNHVFTVKNLNKYPSLDTESVIARPARAEKKYHGDEMECRRQNDICKDAMRKIMHVVKARTICLRELFSSYDKFNHGYVTRAQLRATFSGARVSLLQEELNALEWKYTDDEFGFNYVTFVADLEALLAIVPAPLEDPPHHEDGLINLEEPKFVKETRICGRNIQYILSKIKAKVICGGLHVRQYMEEFDIRHDYLITESEFHRGLDQLHCGLSRTEVAAVIQAYRSKERAGFVEYRKFIADVEVTDEHLEKRPRHEPFQHVPCTSSRDNFLDFDERQILSKALKKLSCVRDHNLLELFVDLDNLKVGSVSKECFQRALSTRKMMDLVTDYELNLIFKCFSKERFGKHEIIYREFLYALELVQESFKYLP